MNLLKKGLALGLTAVMAGSLAACNIGGDTNWVAKSGDMTVSAGVYLLYQIDQYQTSMSKLPEDTKDPLKAQIDGQAVPDVISKGAKDSLNQYIAVENKFNELGLSIDPATKSILDENVEMFWGYLGASYEKNGISKESYTKVTENDSKRSMIFEAIYGEGGSQAVPDADLKAKFLADYAKIMVIPLNYMNSDDPAQQETDKKAAEETINKYYDQLKAGGNVEDIVFEAKKEVSKDDTLTKPEPGTSFTIISRDSSPYADNVTKAIFDAKIGEPVKVESEDTKYLFVRYDVGETESDFVARKSSIVQQLKGDEFNETVKGWGDSITGVTYNEKALSRYTPNKLKMK